MFNQLFTSPRSLERYASSPLLEERLRYLAHCAAQGSTRSLSVSSRNTNWLSSTTYTCKQPMRSQSSRSMRPPICGSAVNRNPTATT